MLEVETGLGCRQYVIFASGYDTFGMRNTNEELKIYELDLPELLEDKSRRIEEAGLKSRSVQVPCNLADETWKEKLMEGCFRSELKSFCSLLGISYYLEKRAFERLVGNISTMVPRGSSLFFDYPEAGESGMAEGDINDDVNGKNDINHRLAAGTGEEIISSYSYDELVRMLEKYGFKIYEHLNDDEMTDQFFMKFNIHNRSHHISAPKGVSYCYAVKWR